MTSPRRACAHGEARAELLRCALTGFPQPGWVAVNAQPQLASVSALSHRVCTALRKLGSVHLLTSLVHPPALHPAHTWPLAGVGLARTHLACVACPGACDFAWRRRWRCPRLRFPQAPVLTRRDCAHASACVGQRAPHPLHVLGATCPTPCASRRDTALQPTRLRGCPFLSLCSSKCVLVHVGEHALQCLLVARGLRLVASQAAAPSSSSFMFFITLHLPRCACTCAPLSVTAQ